MLIFAIHIFLYVQTTLFKIFCSAQFVDNNQFSAQFENRKADKSKEKLVVVDTLMGKVIGVNKGPVNLFLGIPYAEPPVGKLRFRPPKPKRHWQSKVYNATHFAPECLQSTLFAGESESRIKDEDCLYLNIWQPVDIRKSKIQRDVPIKYPVLVWIYGGAFVHGGSSLPEYYGDKLAARGVIVVSFNYRLGIFGFLVSTADGLFGNYGLDDQKTALQWVQDHISSFGGDPDRITLFGESAGAMSIGLHILDQQLKLEKIYPVVDDDINYGFPRKLFHAAILQSNPFGYKYRSISVANFVGTDFRERLDCEDLRCLQSESAEELLHVQDTMMMTVPRSIGDFFAWGPVETDQAYFREVKLRSSYASNITVRQPIEAIKLMQKNGIDIPIILGTNVHEGTVFVFSAFPARMNKLVYQLLVVSFFRASALRVLKMYRPLANRVSDSHDLDYRLVLASIIGDYLFRCPNQFVAERLSSLGTKVFLYEFALATRTPGFPCCDGLACHTCELPYVFNQLDVIEAEYSWSEEVFHRVAGSSIGGSSEEEDLPDIFGASSSARGETCSAAFRATISSSNFSNANKKNEQRSKIDERVSRFIANYWTAFSTHGDPNGASGSFTNDLYWPRLMGELSSASRMRPEEENWRDPTTAASNHRENTRRPQIISTGSNNNNAEVYEVASEFDGMSGNPVEDENDDIVLDEEMMRSAADDSFDFRERFARQMNGDYFDVVEVPPVRPNHFSEEGRKANRKVTNEKEVKFQMNKKRTVLERFRNGNEARISRIMHQMLFDEVVQVDIFSNDCTCTEWNKMGYVF